MNNIIIIIVVLPHLRHYHQDHHHQDHQHHHRRHHPHRHHYTQHHIRLDKRYFERNSFGGLTSVVSTTYGWE